MVHQAYTLNTTLFKYTHHVVHYSLSFSFSVPHRAAMLVGPASGHRLVSWSLESYIPPSTIDNGRPNEHTYFVFYARGTGEKGEFTFWIEVEVSKPFVYYYCNALKFLC